LKVTSRSETKAGSGITHVTVENPSKSLAFFVRLKVNQSNQEILPVIWQDNYISLLPGEKREITASYATKGNTKPTVEVSGWNVE
jgi:exo-1,4-beta-D-glucosaminidase